MTDQSAKRLKMEEIGTSSEPEQAAATSIADDTTHQDEVGQRLEGATDADGCTMQKLDEQHEVPETHTRCHFFLQKKSRLCKMQKVKGQNLCLDHMQAVGVKDGEKERIPCPYDSSHTCYKHLLWKHKKNCNSRPELRPSYFCENLNSGDFEGEDVEDCKVSLKDVPFEDLLLLINKIQSIHNENIKELRSEILFHPVMTEETEKSTNGIPAQKHLQQQASLIAHMQKMNLLKSSSAFIEFGAGKGGLSHWLQLALKDEADVAYYLVEKSGVRYKMDNHHKRQDQGPSFERLRINIADLDLGKVKSLQEKPLNVVGIGKHLCGGATDMMLRCLVETYVKSEQKKMSHLEGVVLAYCCHHRCDWKTYVGKKMMRKFGISASDFHLITRMTSWAVSRNQFDTRTPKERKRKSEHVEGETTAPPRYGGLSVDEREEIGYKCKQLIDEGRRCYLEEQNFKAEVIYYTEKERTLENMALIATVQKS